MFLAGCAIELGCQPGTYQPNKQQANCTQCAPGFYCPADNMTSQYFCRAGYYCPGGDTSGVKCPAGTYNNRTGAKLPTDCSDCPKGLYCLEGSVNPTGKCQKGYYCQGQAASKAPSTSTPKYPKNGPCESGAYCPEGTAAPVLCPEGTYRSTPGAASASDCAPCDPKYYCKGYGLKKPSGDCQGGWYCPEGSQDPTPKNLTCWAGHYCPNGTALPIPCPTGNNVLDFLLCC